MHTHMHTCTHMHTHIHTPEQHRNVGWIWGGAEVSVHCTSTQNAQDWGHAPLAPSPTLTFYTHTHTTHTHTHTHMLSTCTPYTLHTYTHIHTYTKHTHTTHTHTTHTHTTHILHTHTLHTHTYTHMRTYTHTLPCWAHAHHTHNTHTHTHIHYTHTTHTYYTHTTHTSMLSCRGLKGFRWGSARIMSVDDQRPDRKVEMVQDTRIQILFTAQDTRIQTLLTAQHLYIKWGGGWVGGVEERVSGSGHHSSQWLGLATIYVSLFFLVRFNK